MRAPAASVQAAYWAVLHFATNGPAAQCIIFAPGRESERSCAGAGVR